MTISIVPVHPLSVADIKVLRSLSACSISTIKRAAELQTSIRDFEIFGSHWEEERPTLAKLYRHYSSDVRTPYTVRESSKSGDDEYLSPEDLKTRMEFWRSIELKTELHMDLRLGYIHDPDEFQPHDEDWF